MTSREQPPDSLLGSLEQDYTAQAQDRAAQETAALHDVLKEPLPETTPVYERSFFTSLILLAVGGFLLVLGLALFQEARNSGAISAGEAAGFALPLALAGLVLYRIYKLIRYWKTPLFTLSLAGVQFRGLESLTPWAQVDNYMVNVTTYYGFITISARVDFDLSPGKPFDWPVKKPYRLKYRPKKNQVHAGGVGLSPSTKKVAKLIGHYRAQSYALDRLAELGGGQ